MRVLLWIAVILAVILFFPLGVRVNYNDAVLLRLYVFCIPITLLPAKEKKTDEPEKDKTEELIDKVFDKLSSFFSKEEKPENKEEQDNAEKGKAKKKKSGGITEMLKEEGSSGILELLALIAKIAAGTFGRLLRGIILPYFDFEMSVGGGDADQAAVGYGRMCAAVYPMLSVIFRVIRVFRKRMRIYPDFVSEKLTVRLDTLMLIFPGLVLWQALRALVTFIIGYVKHRIKRNKDQERKL